MKKFPTLHAILKKKNRVLTWCAIIFCTLTIVGLGAGAVIYSRSIPEPIPMNDAIINHQTNEWCYVDVETMTDYFATYEEDDVVKHRYYFVWDHDYIYIAVLDDQTVNHELSEILEFSYSDETEGPSPVRIQGMSESISSDLKKIALDQLNEWYAQEMGEITEEEFDDICGTVLLNVKENPNSFFSMPVGIGIVSWFLALIFLIVLWTNERATKKEIKKIGDAEMEMLDAEISNNQAMNIDGLSIYLTKNYVVDLTNRLRVYRYEDIKWLYLYRVRSYGMTTSVSIQIGDCEGKVKPIGSSTRKYEQAMTDTLVEIANRCPEVMVGFTSENKKAYKQYKKSLKK